MKLRQRFTRNDKRHPQNAESVKPIVVDGARNKSGNQSRHRITLVMIGVCFVYAVIAGRLVQYGFRDLTTVASISRGDALLASRPNLLDRNGQVLATDIRTVSLYAKPHKITDPDEVIERLATVLPELDVRTVYRKLTSKSQFQWLRRQLTPRQQNDILALGIPGVGFRPEKRRFYPGGPTASHIVGHVNIDNKGIAGMEKYVDGQGLADLASVGLTIEQQLEPVRLSIDLRVQHIVRDELAAAMQRYRAIAAGAVVLNAKTGEVLAMSSLPDYDPNVAGQALEKDRLNRMSAGTYEMGSTFKTFTTAMALDSGLVTLNSSLMRPSHCVLPGTQSMIFTANAGY